MKIIILIILIISIPTILYMKNNTSKLATKIKNTTSSEYNVPFDAQAGTIVQFEGFDVFAKGERPLSIFDKWHNWKNRKSTGGTVTPSTIFEIREKNGKKIETLALQKFPFSWESFKVGEKDFTITPNNIEAGFVVYDGDIDYARGERLDI